DADLNALVERQVDEVTAAKKRSGGELGEEGRLDCVETDPRVVVEQERVRLYRARLRVDAGDRFRVDLVAQVRPVRLPPADHRVGERLQRRVGEVHRRGRV